MDQQDKNKTTQKISPRCEHCKKLLILEKIAEKEKKATNIYIK